MGMRNLSVLGLGVFLSVALACSSKGKQGQVGPGGQPIGPGGAPLTGEPGESSDEPEDDEEPRTAEDSKLKEQRKIAAALQSDESDFAGKAEPAVKLPPEAKLNKEAEPSTGDSDRKPKEDSRPASAPDVVTGEGKSSQESAGSEAAGSADVVSDSSSSQPASKESSSLQAEIQARQETGDAGAQEDAKPSFDKNVSKQVFDEAKKFIEKGTIPKAVELLEKWLQKTPMDHVNRRNLIHILMKLEDLEKAEFHLRFMTREVPQEKEWWAHLGRILSQLGKYKEAAETLAQAVELRPGDSDLILDLARVHSKRKDWEAARKVLEKALVKAPENTEMLSDLAAVLVELGEYNSAFSTYRKLQRIKPTYETALTMANIASQYERCDDVVDALVDWEKSFQDETPHLLLASCAMKAKEPVTAQKHLLEGMKLNKKCFYCALWMGDLHFETMDWANAVKYYAQAAPLKPQDYRPFNQLGKALSNSGKHIEASRAFAKANERKPKDPDIIYMWAMSLVRAGQKGDAWKVWGILDELDNKRAAEIRALLVE